MHFNTIYLVGVSKSGVQVIPFEHHKTAQPSWLTLTNTQTLPDCKANFLSLKLVHIALDTIVITTTTTTTTTTKAS